MINRSDRTSIRLVPIGTIVVAAAAIVIRVVNASAPWPEVAFWVMALAAVGGSLMSLTSNPSESPFPPITRTDERNGLTYTFPIEQVAVTIQKQPAGPTPKPLRAPSVDISQLRAKYPGVTDDFTPARFVMNLELVDPDDPSKILTHFDPKVTVEIPYIQQDLDRARKHLIDQAKKKAEAEKRANTSYEPTQAEILAALELGFWDGTKWIKFTPQKHGYTIGRDGKATVTLSEWADPPIGWGPP